MSTMAEVRCPHCGGYKTQIKQVNYDQREASPGQRRKAIDRWLQGVPAAIIVLIIAVVIAVANRSQEGVPGVPVWVRSAQRSWSTF